MISFYYLDKTALVWMNLLSLTAIILQTIALAKALQSRMKRSFLRWSLLMEATVLAHILLLLYLNAKVSYYHSIGFIVEPGESILRILIVLLLTVEAIFVSRFRRQWQPFLVPMAAVLTLPFAERLSGNSFVVCYIVSLLYWAARGIHMVLLYRKEAKSNLTQSSVQFAVDSLGSGLLFGTSDADIILMNQKMQELMHRFGGKIYGNSDEFYAFLHRSCTEEYLEEKLICPLEEQSVWMFTRAEIPLKQERYVQISATDIGEIWNLTMELRTKNQQLEQQSLELKKVIETMEKSHRRRELLHLKNEFHDILGQRVALLLRSMRERQKPDRSLLETFSENPVRMIRTKKQRDSASDRLKTICESFAELGIGIEIDGVLPRDKEHANTFVNIIREAATNAVRHGLANRIFVTLRSPDKEERLTVSDNGSVGSESITEGSGIRGMRRRLLERGGSLEITVYPEFTVTARIPKKEEAE